MQQQRHPLKTLNIIHKSLFAGQLIFGGIVIFLFSNGIETAPMKEYDRIFQVVAIIVAGAGYLIGTKIFKKQIWAARESGLPAKQKFETYRKASIMLWALLEVPCLLCIIFFYLTANYAFIVLAGALIFLFFIFGPSREKIKLYLSISDNELDFLD